MSAQCLSGSFDMLADVLTTGGEIGDDVALALQGVGITVDRFDLDFVGMMEAVAAGIAVSLSIQDGALDNIVTVQEQQPMYGTNELSL